MSTVPIGVAAEAHRYLAEGGPANLAQLHAFLSDTVLLTGEGFEPPAPVPAWGVVPRPAQQVDADGDLARVGVLFYRAHESSGNNRSPTRCATQSTPPGRPSGFRSSAPRCAPRLTSCTTRWAPSTRWSSPSWPPVAPLPVRSRRAATTRPGTCERIAALDIPVIQGLCLTSSRAEWEASDEGVDAARLREPDRHSRVRRPHHHGAVHVQGDRRGRPAPLRRRPRAVRAGRRHRGQARAAPADPGGRAPVALMLSAYPTKHSRVGNAVGLDTPVSTIRLLRRMRDAGYDLGAPGQIPGLDDSRTTPSRRRRTDPRTHRCRRPGRGVADQRPAHRRPRAASGPTTTCAGPPSCPRR